MKPHPLKRERELRGWSQARVADRVGTTTRTVARWETGVAIPYPYYREKLCALFGKNATELGLLPVRSEAQTDPTPSSSQERAQRTPLHDPMLPLFPGENTALIGRSTLFTQLKQRLCAGGDLALTALNGLPGVGKTALALALVTDPEVQSHFYDGILWVGLGLNPNLVGLLSRWGTLLGAATTEMAHAHDRSSWEMILRGAISTRHMLLVIDDAWKVEEALAFQVGGPHCAHLLTTRSPQIAFAFAEDGALELSELDEADGIELLARFVPELVSSDMQAARALVHSVGALPLALTLLGKYLATQAFTKQPRRLQTALTRLQDAEQRLHITTPLPSLKRPMHLPEGTPWSLYVAIELSDQQLDQQAQEALRALSVFPTRPDSFSEEAALSVIQQPVEVLDSLSDAGLLESPTPGRYSLHQTIADYARLHLQDTGARQRLASHMIQYVQQHKQDDEALAQESSNIIAAFDIADELDMTAILAPGLHAFAAFLLNHWSFPQAEHYSQRALEAARRQNEPAAIVDALFDIGSLCAEYGHFQQARTYMQEGLTLARQHELTLYTSKFLGGLGGLSIRHGDHARAETYLQEGLTLARQLADQEQVCRILTSLGTQNLELGNYVQAQAYLEEGVVLARPLRDQGLLCRMLSGLGMVVGQQGNYVQAEAYLQEGLTMAQQLKHQTITARIFTSLGVIADQRGDYAQAEAYLQEGLTIARKIGSQQQITALLANLGAIVALRGNYAQAETYLQEGIVLARELDSPYWISSYLDSLAMAAREQGRYEHVEEYLQEGLRLALSIEDRDQACYILVDLAKVAGDRREYQQAETHLQESMVLAQQLKSSRLICVTLCEQGELQLKQQQIDKTEATFHSILTRFPQESRSLTAQAYYGLARAAALDSRNSEARELAETSLAYFKSTGLAMTKVVEDFLHTLPTAPFH